MAQRIWSFCQAAEAKYLIASKEHDLMQTVISWLLWESFDRRLFKSLDLQAYECLRCITVCRESSFFPSAPRGSRGGEWLGARGCQSTSFPHTSRPYTGEAWQTMYIYSDSHLNFITASITLFITLLCYQIRFVLISDFCGKDRTPMRPEIFLLLCPILYW